MRQFRNAPEDEESVEMSEGLQNLSLTSSQNKGSGPRTSQELSVTPAPPEDVIDSSSSSKPSTPNKKVKNVSQSFIMVIGMEVLFLVLKIINDVMQIICSSFNVYITATIENSVIVYLLETIQYLRMPLKELNKMYF